MYTNYYKVLCITSAVEGYVYMYFYDSFDSIQYQINISELKVQLNSVSVQLHQWIEWFNIWKWVLYSQQNEIKFFFSLKIKTKRSKQKENK